MADDVSVLAPAPAPVPAPATAPVDLTAVLARLDALEKASAAKTPPANGHCWAPVLDHGGQVPVYMAVDAEAQPTRFIATTRSEALELHFRCCRCPARGTRKFKSGTRSKTDGHGHHGDHHHHYDTPEVSSLPSGPCPGAPTPAPAVTS